MVSASELTKIIEDTESQLLGYAISLLKNKASAEDAVQETYIRFIKYLKSDNGKTVENPPAWLFRTLRNLCFDSLRSKEHKSRSSLPPEELKLNVSDQNPQKHMIEHETTEIMLELISRLPERQREILTLKMEHGKSYNEIAEIMNLKAGNIGFILHSTIKKLREEYSRVRL